MPTPAVAAGRGRTKYGGGLCAGSRAGTPPEGTKGEEGLEKSEREIKEVESIEGATGLHRNMEGRTKGPGKRWRSIHRTYYGGL